MIFSLESDLPSFKKLSFKPGLNVLLADKSPGANDRQTRNGAGKTSFVELVHFLTGGDAKPDSIFRNPALSSSTFDMVVDLGPQRVTAYRSGSKPSRITVLGDPGDWPLQPALDPATGVLEFTNEQWKSLLGYEWFSLPVAHADDEDAARGQPSFRSLFPYFARRQAAGGFLRPVQHSEKQQPWDQQVSLSYLLGLDWSISRRLHDLKAQEKIAKDLGRAARSGELGRYFGRASEIRTKLALSEAKVQRMREQLSSFRVVPEYEALEREANELTEEIADISDSNTIDRELVSQLNDSLREEDASGRADLEKLYAEANVVLPDLVLRRLTDVQAFHAAILENRKSHLSSEKMAAERRIVERDQRQGPASERRAQIMQILKSGGALDHYSRLREELGRAEADAETLRQRLETAERLEGTKADLDIERATIAKALKDDLSERRERIQEAVLVFEELSESLLQRAGSLTIADTPNGLSVEVNIEAQRSKGITNMQIFCFDMMLAVLGERHGRSPGFLIHDSHLFDGVDERQVAKALQLGAQYAEANGFQYIVTMNTDAIPEEGFRPGFNLRDYAVSPRLTDAEETGGLFGLRFD